MLNDHPEGTGDLWNIFSLEPRHEIGLPNYYVNSITCDLYIEDVIYAYNGLGPDIAFVLKYRSNSSRSGIFGNSWAMQCESSVELRDSETVAVTRGISSGCRFRISFPGKPSYPIEAQNMGGAGDRLLLYESYWIFIESMSGLVMKYGTKISDKKWLLTSVSDLDGNTVMLSYDRYGRLVLVTDACRRETHFTLGPSGLCTRITLPDKRYASFRYDSSNRLEGCEDLQGIRSEYHYNDEGNISRMVVGEDRKTTVFSYDPGRKIKSVRNPAGSDTYFTRIDDGHMRITDPEGNSTEYFSEDHRTVRVVNALGHALEYVYRNGRLIQSRSRNGRIHSMEYTDRGELSKIIDPNGKTRSLTRDPYGYLVSETDEIGREFTYSYDARHRIAKITGPGGVMSLSYDPRGLPDAITDIKGRVYRYQYDQFGNPVEVTGPQGLHYRYHYDPHGFRLTSVTDRMGASTKFEYDNNDRLTRIIHPDGSSRSYTYGCCALKSMREESGITTEYTRNPLTAVTGITVNHGPAASLAYNRNNQPVAFTDMRGVTTKFRYDAVGNLVEMVRQNGYSITYTYDPDGNCTGITDERGNRTLLSYDLTGTRSGLTDAAGNMVHYSHDSCGNPVLFRNARGNTIELRYDRCGRLIEKLYDRERVATYEYDSTGNFTRITDRSGTSAYQYDILDRLVKARFPQGCEIGFSYNEIGDLHSVLYHQGLEVVYSYDTMNRISRLDCNGHWITFSYDNAGNLILENRSNGTTTEYHYDPLQNVTRIIHRDGNTILADLQYEWDPNGNLLSEQVNAPAPVNAIVPPSAGSARYNNLNQLVSWNHEVYQYDVDGNLVSINGGRNISAMYDPENHLTEMTVDGSRISYEYNGLGFRVGVRRDDKASRFCIPESGLVFLETDQSGKPLKSMIYDESRIVATMDSGNNIVFHHFDKIGNIITVTDKDGNVVQRNSFSPAGQRGRDNPPSAGVFSYIGAFGVMEEGGGLYFMKNRFYDSVTGRFLQKDPVGFGGGYNLYSYVNNNPLSFIDPDGTGKKRATGKGKKPECKPDYMRYTDMLDSFVKNTASKAAKAARGNSYWRAATKYLDQRLNYKNQPKSVVQQNLDLAAKVAQKKIDRKDAQRKFTPGSEIQRRTKEECKQMLITLGEAVMSVHPLTAELYGAEVGGVKWLFFPTGPSDTYSIIKAGVLVKDRKWTAAGWEIGYYIRDKVSGEKLGNLVPIGEAMDSAARHRSN